MIPDCDDLGYLQNVAAELMSGFPVLDIQIVNEQGFEEFVGVVFAIDRRARPKEIAVYQSRVHSSAASPG